VTTTLTNDTDAARYELRIDGALAAIETYTLEPGVISFNHTEALEGFEGTGAARQLTEGILDDARARRLAVLPYCPYVASFIGRHPDTYLDLVPADRRAEFGL
jgi:predicted GNAT family acetyltransferase